MDTNRKKDFFKTRTWLYIQNCILAAICWQIMGFEFTVIVGVGLILGELDYINNE